MLLNLQLSDILPIRFSILWRLDTNSHIRLFNTDPDLIEHRWEFGSGEDGKERKRGRRRGGVEQSKVFQVFVPPQFACLMKLSRS